MKRRRPGEPAELPQPPKSLECGAFREPALARSISAPDSFLIRSRSSEGVLHETEAAW